MLSQNKTVQCKFISLFIFNIITIIIHDYTLLFTLHNLPNSICLPVFPYATLNKSTTKMYNWDNLHQLT